jgi:Calcineurin-like phosphoesterase
VFVGDLIDRGPQQREVVNTVRSMQQAGSARICMGNHEWNALGWALQDPSEPGEFLRRHNQKHFQQHEAFLQQVGEGSADYTSMIGWFRTMPLWLELPGRTAGPGLRVVHACWDVASMEVLRPYVGGGKPVGDDLLVNGHCKGSPENDAIEVVLKGLEATLPDGATFTDKGGHTRHEARVKWWAPPTRTFRNATLAEGLTDQLPDIVLPGDLATRIDPDPRPLLFGHYWHKGTPSFKPTQAVCVDYSAVLGGSLVAYRWNGEAELLVENLVSVVGASATSSLNGTTDEL